MSKVTSEDCTKWIVLNICPASEAGDWKRVNKRKVGSDIVRVFQNRKIPEMTVEVSEAAMAGKVRAVPKTSSNTILAALRANPVKVSFLPPVEKEPEDWDDEDRGKFDPDFSGRVVYAIDDDWPKCYDSYLRPVNTSEANDGTGEFCFYCGPETTDRAVHDTYDGGCYDKLEELLSDIPNKMVGDAENFHSVHLIPGVSAKDLWDVVRERLERSGAVKMEDW